MKAFILAAGLGTRLQSLKLDVPKVMVPIGGKPLLQHHLEMLRDQGIREIIVNLHYLPEKITGVFGDGSGLGVSITYSHEPQLLGTAGAVKKMADRLSDGTFLVLYGDNLVKIEFGPLVEFHQGHRAVATVALFESAEPWTGGMVETDGEGRVRRFVEKPDPRDVSTNLISAGILVLEPRVLESIPANQFSDFGREVIPKMVADGYPVYAMKPQAYIQDVGTPERLARAQRDFENGLVGR